MSRGEPRPGEEPRPARVLHHVYTSERGYRTVALSEGAQPAEREALEELARRLYPRGAAREKLYLTRRGRTDAAGRPAVGIALSRTVPLGTDDAGRPRVLVHTAYLRPETVEEQPRLCPLGSLDQLFPAAEGADDLALHALTDRLDPWPWERQARRALARLREDPRCARTALVLLLSGTHTLALEGDARAGAELVADLWPLLPPRIRHRLTISSDGASEDGGQPPTVRLLEPGAAAAPAGAGEVRLTLTTGRLAGTPPLAHAYARDLLDAIAGYEGALMTLLRFLERYDELAEPAHFVFNLLGEACVRVRPHLDRHGELSTAESRDLGASLLVPLRRAGLARAAEAILDGIAARIHGDELAGALGRARAALTEPGPDADHAFEALATWLRRRGGTDGGTRAEAPSTGLFPGESRLLFMLHDDRAGGED